MPSNNTVFLFAVHFKERSRKPKALAILKQTMRIMRMFLVGTREFFKDFRGVLWACWKRCWAAWEGLVWGPPPPLQPEMGGEVDPPTNRATPAQEKFLRCRREIFAKNTRTEKYGIAGGGVGPLNYRMGAGGEWSTLPNPPTTHRIPGIPVHPPPSLTRGWTWLEPENRQKCWLAGAPPGGRVGNSLIGTTGEKAFKPTVPRPLCMYLAATWVKRREMA